MVYPKVRMSMKLGVLNSAPNGYESLDMMKYPHPCGVPICKSVHQKLKEINCGMIMKKYIWQSQLILDLKDMDGKQMQPITCEQYVEDHQNPLDGILDNLKVSK